MRPARLAFVLCCWFVIGILCVTAVAGAPPPEQLCGVCGPSTANEAAITGATGHGTLDIYIDDAGDSRWEARVPVTETAAERYRTNATALEAAVDDAWARYHAADGDVRTVDSRLEDETVVVNYTVDDVASRGVGDAWLVEYFAVGTSNTRYGRVADRVTVHTPEGTEITNRVPAAEIDGTAATWTDDAEFDEQTYLTYGSGGVRGTVTGYATIGLERGPTALEHGVSGGLFPAVLLGLVGVVIGRIDTGIDAFDAATLERLIVAVGAVGAGGFLVVGVAATGADPAPGAVALAALGVATPCSGVRPAGSGTDSRLADWSGCQSSRRSPPRGAPSCSPARRCTRSRSVSVRPPRSVSRSGTPPSAGDSRSGSSRSPHSHRSSRLRASLPSPCSDTDRPSTASSWCHGSEVSRSLATRSHCSAGG